jgi:hydrogenase nickel incorporation protein HypB
MCESCGCGDERLVPVEVHQRILRGNDLRAAHNREHFRETGVLAINVMGSPGSGKTAVLEATACRLAPHLRIAAISGDLATDRDAERLRAAGIPSVGITTGSACHLDADLVHEALHGSGLHGTEWEELDLLFVENVGNLVCPAVFDLGQEANVVVLSVTEGDDKPLKYPVMFRKADLVLVTKIDLLPHLPEVRIETIRENLARVMPGARAIPLSARAGAGLEEWIAWLEERLDRLRTSAAAEAAL